MGLFDRLFGGRREDPADAAFRKLYAFMTDESIQNSAYPAELQRIMAAGGRSESVRGATGDFGRELANPIPVNGPIGELIYISNLATLSHAPVIAHRLGSAREIDVYEVLALDGSRWDLLFFTPYYASKSRKLPVGYELKPEAERFFFATNQAVPSFPAGFYGAMRECTSRILGRSLVAPSLRDEARYCTLSRPAGHAAALRALHLEARA